MGEERGQRINLPPKLIADQCKNFIHAVQNLVIAHTEYPVVPVQQKLCSMIIVTQFLSVE